MIWSFAEIWVPLAIAFLLGCGVGSLIFQRLSRGRLAGRQASVHRRIEGLLPQPRERARRREEAPPVPVPAPAAVQPATPSRKVAERVESVASAAPSPAASAAPVSPPPTSAAEPERPAPTRRAARTIELPIVTVPSPEEIAAGRPPALDGPRGGKPDNLRKIKGIGGSFEARLHGLGIFHFDQISEWSLKQAAWVAMETGAADRVIRNDWVGQAKALAEELRGGTGSA
jgi:predicted flap endonuclease-1-like 5' DNA nuclease